MEAPTSTGKVKVEYSDPYGVFQLVASEFDTRLPLKTLNWTSSTRPTRSIDSLYVDLVLDERNAPVSNIARAGSVSGTPDTPVSPTPSGEYKRDAAVPKRERRHQIPGLRRTPYLKIYVLRCDDSDTYKSTARRAVREWIKANSSSNSNSSGSNQENHDAFEYMIIHVVMPDVQTGALWPTKASASVLEKLKSDFNSSSRNSPDRIVQIPVTKILQVQGVTVHPVPTGPAKDVFLMESKRAWEDLIAKMKVLILNSFDNRVKQYEEDIKEKGMQRSLPGWNFCTFFVLKEGLLRGFESVGLVDDALMGYDELSVELLSAIREDNGKDSRLFREHTQELLIQAEAALHGQDSSNTKATQKRLSSSILETDNKPYRELIVQNNISIFDFRSYVFARHTQIMLRLAALSGKALTTNASNVDLLFSRDPVVLADICWRAKEFFSDMARIVRQDLKASFKADGTASSSELRARYNITENLISSWIYKGAIDILNRTREPGLPDVAITETENNAIEATGFNPMDTISRPKSPSDDLEPTSLDTALSPARSRALSPASFRSRERLSIDSIRHQSSGATSLSSGASSLAAERAELYLVARRALSAIGERQGWKTTWPMANEELGTTDFDEVSLEDKPAESTADASIITDSSMAGILDTRLCDVLSDQETFYQHWEELSLLAFLLFDVAKVRKSVYSITADIAAARVRRQDYAYAAPFLKELGSKYATNQWHDLEAAVLDMYVFCLQKLNNKNEYVPAALHMLAKSASSKDTAIVKQKNPTKMNATLFGSVSMGSIIEASTALASPVQVMLEDFFVEAKLDQFIIHSENNDEYGFNLVLNPRSLGTFQVDEARVNLYNIIEGTSRELSLVSSGPVTFRESSSVITVLSKTMVPGWFMLDSIVLTAGKVRFYKSLKSTTFVDRHLGLDPTTARYLLWPSTRACTIDASICDVIQLEQPRAVVFSVAVNKNEIDGAKLLIKSLTAGLRLQTSDAEIISGEAEITKDKQPSIVPFGRIAPDTIVKIKVPYRTDGDIKQVHIRSELSYNVEGETFVYGTSHRLAAQLPLGVNVQDIFKKEALFSKFAISTSSEIPIRVISSALAGNNDFDITTPYMDDDQQIVFPKQPASLVYRIRPKSIAEPRSWHRKLFLKLDYQCLDEQVLWAAMAKLRDDFSNNELHRYIGLLDLHYRTIFREFLRELDLERVELLREIIMPDYVRSNWDDVLQTLPYDTQVAISTWLKDWHVKHTVIRLNIGNNEIVRHIEIPVEIPSLPVLHTASLEIEQCSTLRPYIVGEIVGGELRISHTRSWSSQDSKTEEPLAFVYELEASTESWLIAGQKRGYFTAKEGELKRFPIMLLPLRAGRLMLPIVEIRSAREDGGDERAACETDYQSLGTAIEVVTGVTGISLDVLTNSSGGLDGEVEILEVEREGRVVA